MMSGEPSPRAHLRWLGDTYQRVQAVRLETGERIRAVVQGRAAECAPVAESAAALLQRIRCGETDGPIPILGQTYRMHAAAEQALRSAMADALSRHEAWTWLGRVCGMGPTLGAKLLGRLDIARAPTPSSFWAYCGLATVPATRFRCDCCGTTRTVPIGRGAPRRHSSASGACDGRMTPMPEPARIAPPPQPAGRRTYDHVARRTCYQIGVALLRARGAYYRFYWRERTRLERSRPDWERGHVHMAALRSTEKLLLAHLWTAWTESVGNVKVPPYAAERLGRNRLITHTEMIAS